MDFNLDSIESSVNATHRLVIGKRADGVEAGFVVLGTGSDAYAAASREIELGNVKDAAAREKANAGNQIDATTDEGALVIVDSTAKHRMTLALACTVGWFGFTAGGSDAVADAPFDKARLETLLRAKPLWVRKIVEAIESDENFTQG